MTTLEEHRVKELFSGVRGIAVKVLDRIERTDSYLDKLLDYEIKSTQLSGQDKALLYEIVHGVIRWMGRLDWILSGFYKGQFSKAIPALKNALRVALYQIMFLDKVPDYAVVNEAVEFVKKLQGQKPADITNAVLRNILRSKNALRYPDPEENLIGYYSAYYSHPSWLIKRWVQRYGNEETAKLMEANNERPAITLRVNTLKVSLEKFKELLDDVKLPYEQGKFLPEYFKLMILTNISQWKYFEEGYFTIQDESAGMAVTLLDPKPGQRVLDMCAAPGGKTSHIAAKMENSGELIALDRFESRVKLMNTSFERLGVTNVEGIHIDALEYEAEPFDLILVDAPCSGLGTLSKKPDIKWKKELLDIRRLAVLQEELLEKASKLIKPGGAIVYSTCTIEPEENIDIIKDFLNRHPDFYLQDATAMLPDDIVGDFGCVRSLPHRHYMDGAFAARLIRSAQ